MTRAPDPAILAEQAALLIGLDVPESSRFAVAANLSVLAEHCARVFAFIIPERPAQ